MTFGDDFRWQSQFVSTIQRIVGPFLIVPSPLQVDCHEATDFMVLLGRDIRIAARVRRASCLQRWPAFANEFTIRSHRTNGVRTEWAKVIEDGYADWMFYGHHTGVGRRVYPWMLVDLSVLRGLYAEHGDEIIKQRHISNGDGTFFHALKPGDLIRRYDAANLIVAWEHSGRADRQTDIFDALR